MKLVFLGTSAAQPTGNRGLSCTCLSTDGEVLMFDAGEGAQVAYTKAGLRWNKKMRIFITHMHGDHCVGILGLLQTMTMHGRTESLEIYGPEGIEEFVACNVRMLNFGLSFPVMITAVREGQTVEGRSYTISACKANHKVTAFSYLFVQKDKPGRFLAENARRLGVPEGSMWNRLQSGSNVEVEGRTVRPADVLDGMRRGVRIGISGDTRPTEKLGEFFSGCDYLVFDSTFGSEHEENARRTGHSTATEAATLAKKAGVRHLILTHFSARYDDESILADEAAKIHDSVIAARDLLEVEVE